MVEVFQYDSIHPFWFAVGTFFNSDIWGVNLTQTTKIIDFNITLNDGQLLTSVIHRPLLNAFKYWLVAQGNPAYNGGKILKPETILSKINKVISLINAIIIIGKEIKLAELHLSAISEEVVLDIITLYAAHGIENGLYRFYETLTEYLVKNIHNVTDTELSEFEAEFMYVKRPLFEAEQLLPLTNIQRRKACCYLYQSGAYVKGHNKLNYPNSAYFRKLYPNTLATNSISFKGLDELFIRKNDQAPNEYQSIPVIDNNEGITLNEVSKYLTVFRTLAAVTEHPEASPFDASVFRDITISRINQHVSLKTLGRFSTLPAPVVFNAIKDAFEFVLANIDDILYATYNILVNRPINRRRNSSVVLDEYKYIGFQEFLPKSLIKLGVVQWAVKDSDPDRFVKRRGNMGFVDLCDVLFGSLEVLVGVTMANRQGEMIDLGAIDCLLPNGKNPQEDRGQEFEMIYDIRKSGMGGEYALREALSKPILNSVAGLVYKVQQFNKKLIDSDLYEQSKLGLFSRIDPHTMCLHRSAKGSYNRMLDAFCDYFETEACEYTAGDVRRFYIRQHQLRRFFAMVFFWSKGFDGLDTLRHFLGHTDCEHLYRYVTEGISGHALAGVKALALLDTKSQEHIEHIEMLEPVLIKHLKTKRLGMKSVSDSIEEYDDEYFSTLPPVSSLKEQADREMLITYLITEHVIDLEPEFLTIKLSDGSEKRDFNLVLHVFDNEGKK